MAPSIRDLAIQLLNVAANRLGTIAPTSHAEDPPTGTGDAASGAGIYERD